MTSSSNLSAVKRAPRRVGFIAFFLLTSLFVFLTLYLGIWDAHHDVRDKFLSTGDSQYWAASWFAMIFCIPIAVFFGLLTFLLGRQSHLRLVSALAAIVVASSIASVVSWQSAYNGTPYCESAASNLTCAETATR